MAAYTHSRVEVSRFLEESMTHVSGEQILKERGENIADYIRVHLEASGRNGTPEIKGLLYNLRYQMAEEALDHKCALVTDIEHRGADGHIILVGSGLKKKTGFR